MSLIPFAPFLLRHAVRKDWRFFFAAPIRLPATPKRSEGGPFNSASSENKMQNLSRVNYREILREIVTRTSPNRWL
jgi:hypothetical protein